jgi:hypothetical protein
MRPNADLHRQVVMAYPLAACAQRTSAHQRYVGVTVFEDAEFRPVPLAFVAAT